MENHQPSGPKSGRGRLQEVVVYKRFQLLGFDWEKFGFFDGRSLMGGGRIRKVVAHGGSTVVGVRIYYYSSWRRRLHVHSLRIFSPALPVGRGVYSLANLP